MLLNLFKKRTFPIGVDLGSGYLKMAQLVKDDHGLHLHAAALEQKPYDVTPGTAAWQRWAAETARSLVTSRNFIGKEVVAAMPPEDMFIEQFQISRMPEKQITEAVMAKVAKKLRKSIKRCSF